MLKADNDLLTRTGAGTPMGDLMRRYWIPALLSGDLPERDGQRVRVRLLGEDLIAYRDTSGGVGLLGAHCPHRGASLYFARNEDCGLRCLYHGWKFNAAGECVDLPTEPPESGLKERVRHIAYPCVERGGVVWTYMGPQPQPPLPDLEWMGLPDEYRFLSLRVQECNWLQAMEGDLDSAHGAFLHSRVDGRGSGPDKYVAMADKHPHFEVADSAAGVQIAARRNSGDSYYWRINQFLLPFWTVTPPAGDEPNISGHAWIPIDDEHTISLMFSYDPDRPLSERRRKLYSEGARGNEPGHMTPNGALPFDPTKPYGRYWPKWNKRNDYGASLELQRMKYFSGIAGLWVQDSSVQESMGPIADRTRETLGSTDIGISRVRRRLIAAARALQETGVPPECVSDPASYRMRSVGILLPHDVSWLEGAAPHAVANGPISYVIPALQRE